MVKQVCNLKFMYTSKCMDFLKLVCVNPLGDKDIVNPHLQKYSKNTDLKSMSL